MCVEHENLTVLLPQCLILKSSYLTESLHYDILELGAGTGKFTRKILTYLKEVS